MTTATTVTTSAIKVWAKVNGNEPEKVELRADSDIDDLKNELFTGNRAERRRHYGIFNGVRLPPSAHVPNNTTCERPILFVKIDEQTPETSNNEVNVTRVIATDLSTNESDREIMNTTFTTTPVPSSDDTIRATAIGVTSASHIPPHQVDTIHYKNGDKYVGEVNDNGEPHGKGTMNWKNGRRYEGHWLNGKKHGQGIEYGANGAVNYSGEWADDVAATTS